MDAIKFKAMEMAIQRCVVLAGDDVVEQAKRIEAYLRERPNSTDSVTVEKSVTWSPHDKAHLLKQLLSVAECNTEIMVIGPIEAEILINAIWSRP